MSPRPRTESLIVRYVGRRSIPFIQLYALFVLGHGEDGPGGGFQGGVIFASAFILLALIDGWGAGRRAWPQPLSDGLMPVGALIYGGIGLAALLAGGAYLQYEALAGGDPHHAHVAHTLGLIGIEIGVQVTVSASMVTLFLEMSRPKGYADVTPADRPTRPTRTGGPER